MSSWNWGGFSPRHLAAVLLVCGLGALGCGQKAKPDVADKPAENREDAYHKGDTEPSVKGVSFSTAIPATVKPAPPRDRLHQAFADATLGPDNPPAEVGPPVDRTMTNKSAPQLYMQVVTSWDDVRFTTPDGKKIEYAAQVMTSHGVLKIALMPELSPNHVRNFIVLAKLGYYDGLHFDRLYNEQGVGGSLSCIEAGCPLGTGDASTGSLGYWLKDEFTKSEQMAHSEGVVGFCRAPEADTAATKFYINLNTAPFRDGSFSLVGKVIQGLDVARTISKQPVSNDSDDGSRSKPSKPIVITKVTIEETVAEGDKK